VKDRVVTDIGAKELEDKWATFNWKLIRKRVKNLRQRIYRATQSKKWNQVRSLMKLMLRSQANLLLSIKKVTQINQGRKTAGIDGQKVLSNPGRIKLCKEMEEISAWKVKPTKRIYIPKSNGKKRPLGIPVIKDRVLQAVVKNALEPSWEAKFEPTSYGFRPGRSTHDALAHCHNRLRKGHDTWVLDADIQGAFDNISHEFILDAIGETPGRKLIKQWLKAGYLENEIFHATESGTPQGGVISPLLANIALDGLGELLASYTKVKEYQSSPKAKRQRINKQKLPRYGYCRYADDFVVTAENQEDLVTILPVIREWLGKRGLQINEEKTKIRRADEGFDFLGFHIQQFKGHCITKPQKEKTLNLLKRIREWLKIHKDIPQAEVISHLNPILKGWGNYYRGSASKAAFSYIDNQIWRTLWKWACRRHPNKGKRWIAHKYFTTKEGWKLKANIKNRRGEMQQITLSKLQDTLIVRHTQVKGANSPDDPNLTKCWEHRRTEFGKITLAKGSRLYSVAQKQNWKCLQCNEHLFNDEELQQHHLKEIKNGGLEYEDNLELIHKSCHANKHSKGA
jgi:RNA-directed DNA polymerase